ncbi:murein hydrolase activator EnvC family protein [Rhodoligotrophos defluvii]|uniref:murein hydrolase activator EnvC family protein n=1 Tax=Rhodoligotrophos defluvii TaxID=2561934 RepID=UPI0010CA0911|nr:peptidoglycan DD-metalloendopeptidase family protein [Rhodoligotrophos defluvii]
MPLTSPGLDGHRDGRRPGSDPSGTGGAGICRSPGLIRVVEQARPRHLPCTIHPRIRVATALIIGTVLACLLPTGASPLANTATGEGPSPEEQLKQNELDAVSRELEQRKAREAELSARLAELERESAELSQRLVGLAAKIQSREGAITAAEQRLTVFDEQARALHKRLAERRTFLSELLAGLQRLERNPPPALAVRPDDALQAVRSAMVMGEVVAQLKSQADALSADLANLTELRRRMLREGEVLEANMTGLEQERAEIAALHRQKQALVEATSEQLGEERKRAEAAAAKAASLKDLLRKLETDRLAAAEARRQAEARRLAAQMTPQIPFTRAKGKVNFPAQGAVVRHYGDDNGFGGRSQGVSIATRPEAQVTAPSDGTVKYAGSFRSYGEILILDVGEDYHILLAGLDRTMVQTGQFVRAGEPVGVMGKDPARATLIGDRTGDPRPILYIEFRKNSDTIDPAPWWAGTGREARK